MQVADVRIWAQLGGAVAPNPPRDSPAGVAARGSAARAAELYGINGQAARRHSARQHPEPVQQDEERRSAGHVGKAAYIKLRGRQSADPRTCRGSRATLSASAGCTQTNAPLMTDSNCQRAKRRSDRRRHSAARLLARAATLGTLCTITATIPRAQHRGSSAAS